MCCIFRASKPAFQKDRTGHNTIVDSCLAMKWHFLGAHVCHSSGSLGNPPWKVASFGRNLTNGISSSFSLGIQPKHPSFLVKCPCCKQGRKWLCIFSLPPVVFFAEPPGEDLRGSFFHFRIWWGGQFGSKQRSSRSLALHRSCTFYCWSKCALL